jgi:hypothetical protein
MQDCPVSEVERYNYLVSGTRREVEMRDNNKAAPPQRWLSSKIASRKREPEHERLT